MFGAYLAISLFRLLQLTPSSWDLGIFTEYVKQLANLRAPIVDVRGPGFNLLGDHFQVIVGLIAPFFRVFPSPGDAARRAGAAGRGLGLPGDAGGDGAARPGHGTRGRARPTGSPGACSR